MQCKSAPILFAGSCLSERPSLFQEKVGRITGTTHSVTSSGAIIDARSYAWDGNYNKIQRKKLDPVNPTGNPALVVQDFDYDSIYRMVESKKTPLGQSAQTVAYAFDDVGNRTSVSGAMLGNGAYSLSDTNNSKMNEYTSTPFDGPGHRDYDDNGNFKERDEVGLDPDTFASKKKHSYDVYNQLTEVEVDAGGPWKVLAGNWILGEFTTADGDYYHMSTGGAAPRVAKEKPNGVYIVTASFTLNQDPPPGFEPEYYATLILRAAAPPVSGNEYLTLTITPEGLYVYHWNNGAIEEIGTLTTTGDYLEPGVEYRVEVLVQSTNKVWIRDWYPDTETRPGIQELSITGVFDTTQTGFNNFDWVALGANTDADVEITDVKLERHNSTPFQPVSQTYRYDALGRRIERTTNDGLGNVETTRYFYDGWRVCEEQDASQATQATYVYGRYIDEVITMERGSDEYYYHCDDLYNVVALTDDTGAVVETYAYDDYGMPHITDSAGMSVMKSSVGNPYLFNGRRYDPETGYYYYRTRYLDSHTGRFISRDTIGLWGDANNLGNGYTYVGNNPWTWLDPFGLDRGTACLNPYAGINVGGLSADAIDLISDPKCNFTPSSYLDLPASDRRGHDSAVALTDLTDLLVKGTLAGAAICAAGAYAAENPAVAGSVLGIIEDILEEETGAAFPRDPDEEDERRREKKFEEDLIKPDAPADRKNKRDTWQDAQDVLDSIEHSQKRDPRGIEKLNKSKDAFDHRLDRIDPSDFADPEDCDN